MGSISPFLWKIISAGQIEPPQSSQVQKSPVRVGLKIRIVQNTDQSVPVGIPQKDKIQTVLWHERMQVVKFLNNMGEYVYLPVDYNKPLLITQMEDCGDLVSVFDVMNDERRLSWIVVSKKFEYKNTVYQPGDILQVCVFYKNLGTIFNCRDRD